MNNILVLWNDESVSRLIKFNTHYKIIGDMLHILEVTPLDVTLLDERSNTTAGNLKVMTEKGRSLLRARFIGSGMLERLVEKIALKHDLTVVHQEK